MNICILVNSLTGNTLSIAEKLKINLEKNNNLVSLEKIEPIDGENINETNISNINFEKIIDFNNYALIIIGSPVRGFSISNTLKSYLDKVTSLKNKKVSLFVTHFFPFSFLGGNQTIKQIIKICEEKGAIISNTGIIDWKNKKREEQIENLVNTFSRNI